MKMNLPNKLTLLRVLMIPVFLAVLMGNFFDPQTARYAAVGIFVLAAFTDFLDGYIARKFKLVTNFGKYMDPLADKLLVCAALVAMVAFEDIHLPAWVAILIISREFIITGFRTIAADRNIVLAAGFWGKLKTFTQMVMIVIILPSLDLTHELRFYESLCKVLYIVASALTVISAVDYIYHNINVLKEGKE